MTHITHEREALISETSRLAFEIEAAERNAPNLARHGIQGPYVMGLRERFHSRMAELLELTHAWHPEAQAKVAQSRREHLRRAEECRLALAGEAGNCQA